MTKQSVPGIFGRLGLSISLIFIRIAFIIINVWLLLLQLLWFIPIQFNKKLFVNKMRTLSKDMFNSEIYIKRMNDDK